LTAALQLENSGYSPPASHTTRKVSHHNFRGACDSRLPLRTNRLGFGLETGRNGPRCCTPGYAALPKMGDVPITTRRQCPAWRVAAFRAMWHVASRHVSSGLPDFRPVPSPAAPSATERSVLAGLRFSRCMRTSETSYFTGTRLFGFEPPCALPPGNETDSREKRKCIPLMCPRWDAEPRSNG
jgi:hypothetical protein